VLSCTDNTVAAINDNLLFGTYFNLSFNGHINREEYDPDKYLTFSISNGSLGFYRWSGSYLTPAKAYLDLTKVSSQGANGLRLTFVSGEDGIEQVKPMTRMVPMGVYDMQGRKVADSLDENISLSKGIYIVNGKKIVIR